MKWLTILFGAVVVLSYNACSRFLAIGDGSNGSLSQDQVVAEFEKTVFPLVVEQCSRCHGDFQSPLFALEDDSAQSYQEILSVVDFNDPTNSRLVQRLALDQHFCWSGDGCQSDGEEMLAAIESWITAIGSGGKEDPLEGRVALAAQAVPTGLPTSDDNGWVTMTYPLDDLGSEFAGAQFCIDIQSFGPGAYQVQAPRLVGMSAGAIIKDLRLSVNGSIRPNESTYRTIAIEDTELSDRQVSSAAMLVLEDLGQGQDLILPSFEVLESANTAVRVTPTFQEFQGVIGASCLGCHSEAGRNRGNYNFESVERLLELVLNNDDEIIRNPAVVPGDFINSPIYDSVINGRMPIGGAPVLTQAQQQQMADWINGGARP